MVIRADRADSHRAAARASSGFTRSHDANLPGLRQRFAAAPPYPVSRARTAVGGTERPGHPAAGSGTRPGGKGSRGGRGEAGTGREGPRRRSPMKRMGKVMKSRKTCGTTLSASTKQPLLSTPWSTL